MAAFEQLPTALLAEWLLDAFSQRELEPVLGGWNLTAPVLDDIEGRTPRSFAYEVVEQLERRNLLDSDLFVALIKARPFRIDTFLPAIQGFASMKAIEPRLAVVHAAREQALRSGGISTFIDRLGRLKDTTQDLRGALVLEIAGLERVAREVPMPEPSMSEEPAAEALGPTREPHDGALSSAEAYRERIEQAIVLDDIATAKQRLLAYLEEYHGLARAREEAVKLNVAAPRTHAKQILEILAAAFFGKQPQDPVSSGAVVFSCHNLQKSYHHRGRVSFHLHCGELELRLGEMVGVVGPNASGKSTFLQMLAGRLAPDGDLPNYPYVKTRRLRYGRAWEQIHRGIHLVPQRPSPWHENMFHELCIHAARSGRSSESIEAKVAQVCERLGLTAFLERPWAQLSGGYQVRVELARALVSSAKLLIFDEPLAPLDIGAQMTFLEQLKLVVRDSLEPRVVILSTQHVWEVEQMADRMFLISEGEVVPRPALPHTCLELSSRRFSGEFLDRLRQLGTIHWASSLQTELLLETRLTNRRLIHAEVAKAAHDFATKLESIRDVSGSLLRSLRRWSE